MKTENACAHSLRRPDLSARPEGPTRMDGLERSVVLPHDNRLLDKLEDARRPQRVPARDARAPSLDELLGTAQNAPRPRCDDATGLGYPAPQPGSSNPVENQRACLGELQKLHGAFEDMKLQYREWKTNNPGVPEPTDGQMTLGEILESDLPAHERCVRVVMVIVHEHPEVLEQAGVAPPANPEAPGVNTPAAAPAGNDFFSQMAQMFGPLMQALGPVAQMLGGVLSSPVGVSLLTAACAVIPGAQVIAPFIPVIAPVAGMVLSGAGGMMAGGGPGAAPGGPGMDLGGLINGLGGLLGGVGGVAGAAPGPVPAAA